MHYEYCTIESAFSGTEAEVVTLHQEGSRLVQELRKRTGLSQERFAARLGVTCPTINRWENGQGKPSPLALRQIEALARELGPEVQDLLQEFFPADANR